MKASSHFSVDAIGCFSLNNVNLLKVIPLFVGVIFLVACSNSEIREQVPPTNTTAPTSPAGEGSPADQLQAGLLDELQRSGTVAVIVELDLSNWLQGDYEGLTQEAAITLAQEALLEELNAPEVEAFPYYRYSISPYLALRVNKEGLQILQDSEYVKRLKPDQAMGLP